MFKADDYDLANAPPLRIGFGQHDDFNRKMRDVRLYSRAISEKDIRTLTKRCESYQLILASSAPPNWDGDLLLSV